MSWPTCRPASGRQTPAPVAEDIATPAERSRITAHLSSLGIEDDNPAIRQIVTTDIDGDGSEETIWSAERMGYLESSPNWISIGRLGDYSVIGAFWDGADPGETIFFESQIPFDADVEADPFVLWSFGPAVIQAVADIGDATPEPEVIIATRYEEGGGTRIYRWQPSATPEIVADVVADHDRKARKIMGSKAFYRTYGW